MHSNLLRNLGLGDESPKCSSPVPAVRVGFETRPRPYNCPSSLRNLLAASAKVLRSDLLGSDSCAGCSPCSLPCPGRQTTVASRAGSIYREWPVLARDATCQPCRPLDDQSVPRSFVGMFLPLKRQNTGLGKLVRSSFPLDVTS